MAWKTKVKRTTVVYALVEYTLTDDKMYLKFKNVL